MKNLVFIFCLFFLLSGCAAKGPVMSATEQSYYDRWEEMKKIYSVKKHPILVDGTLRFDDGEKSQRVNFMLWGNENPPYRFDLSVFTSNIAQIYEDENEIIFYLPRDKKVYLHKNINSVLTMLNIEVPFDFNEFASLMQGNFPINNASYGSAKQEKNSNNYIYTIDKNNSAYHGTWKLDDLARPIEWQNGKWIIEFEYDGTEVKPDKIDALEITKKHPKEITFFIRDIMVKEKYNLNAIKLHLPKNVEKIHLE